MSATPAPGFKGRKNVYTCESCGWRAITIDLDEGVTPFQISCETPGCRHGAYSAFYRVRPDVGEPTHEWYRPGKTERKRLSAGMRSHVDQGGLLLRKRA